MEKHILILTDFVGYGNVAMATARAVLTRMGHRVYCLPTALISNTWNFGSCAQLDTTEYLKASLENWDALGFPLDAVVLGYIGDEHQAEFLGGQCKAWRRAGVKLFLDPIFADNGCLYRGVTPERLDFLRALLPRADYVLPNLTEARFLTGEEDPLSALYALGALGTPGALITGVPWEGKSAVLLLEGAAAQILPYSEIPGKFSGAGDAFTALFAGGVLSGLPAREAAQAAISTTARWISSSLSENWTGMGLPVERYF